MRLLTLCLSITILPFFALQSQAKNETAANDGQCGIVNKRQGTGESFLIPDPQNSYQRETNRLLRQEIEELKQAVSEIEIKRTQLEKIKRVRQTYQLIQLDNATGIVRNGRKSNYISRIHFTFKDNRLHCLMLESHTRPVYEPEKWTRKKIRLRFPGIESLELASQRRNMHLLQEMENVDPKHQLELLRRLVLNIKTALYSMDMEIAAYYENRNKKNQWQIDM
jgi:hypothetical protein